MATLKRHKRHLKLEPLIPLIMATQPYGGIQNLLCMSVSEEITKEVNREETKKA
jgi:hypothetical protein